MTQQISAPENQRSEENVKTAMEDIALIKRIINHSEINLRRLGWLFLVYGSATLAFLVFQIVLTSYAAFQILVLPIGDGKYTGWWLVLVGIYAIISTFKFQKAWENEKEFGEGEEEE